MLPNSTDYRPRLPGSGLLSLAFLLAGCAGSPARPPAETAEEAVQVFPAAAEERFGRALGFMEAGDDEQAAAVLRDLAADYPDYAGPLVNLAIIESRDGDDASGIALLENAVVICSQCAPAWNQLGILLRRQGRFEEAESAYRQALQFDPDYALAHYNLGVLYDLYQQQHELAVEHYERYVALAAGPDASVDKWITDLRRRIGAPAQAAKAEGS